MSVVHYLAALGCIVASSFLLFPAAPERLGYALAALALLVALDGVATRGRPMFGRRR